MLVSNVCTIMALLGHSTGQSKRMYAAFQWYTFLLGKFNRTLESKKKIAITGIHVMKGNFGCLLSYTSPNTLGLIHVNINKGQAHHSMVHDQLLQEISHIFEGIGTLKDVEIHLHIDSSVPPVAQPARQIPFHMQQKVSNALDLLEEQRII